VALFVALLVALLVALFVALLVSLFVALLMALLMALLVSLLMALLVSLFVAQKRNHPYRYRVGILGTEDNFGLGGHPTLPICAMC
jgi:hypothetical protein